MDHHHLNNINNGTKYPKEVKDLKEYYEVEKGPFASGLYAKVHRARCKRTGKLFAAKHSPKRKENLNEISLLSKLKSPFIITFQDAFVTPSHVITIMEFAPGGDLQSVIDADIVLSEPFANKYISQCLMGLEYLHGHNIMHLDIKPQNLLLMGDFPNCNIKICDFELSRIWSSNYELRSIVGTPDYIAPEILQFNPLTVKSDIWSLGILTYVILTGFTPFGSETNDSETFSNIIHAALDFPIELFEETSPICISFIKSCLEKASSNRPTATEALAHDWFKFKRNGKVNSILKSKSKSSQDLTDEVILSKRTKSREKLVEKVLATGLKKSLSKSREQLWKSKKNLSMSSEKIERWASIASFPNLNPPGGVTSTNHSTSNSIQSEPPFFSNLNIDGPGSPLMLPMTGNGHCLDLDFKNGSNDQVEEEVKSPNQPPGGSGSPLILNHIGETTTIQSGSGGSNDLDLESNHEIPSISIPNPLLLVEPESQKSVAELIQTFSSSSNASGSSSGKVLEPIAESNLEKEPGDPSSSSGPTSLETTFGSLLSNSGGSPATSLNLNLQVNRSSSRRSSPQPQPGQAPISPNPPSSKLFSSRLEILPKKVSTLSSPGMVSKSILSMTSNLGQSSRVGSCNANGRARPIRTNNNHKGGIGVTDSEVCSGIVTKVKSRFN